MKFFIIFLLSISIVAAFPLGEKNKSKKKTSFAGEKIVASVGSLIITADELKSGYDFGPAFYKKENKSKEIYLKFLINEKLLALDGYKRRIDTVKQVVDLFKCYHDDLITGELFNEEIFSKITVNDIEIDSVITQKQMELKIKWLYTPAYKEALEYSASLHKGVSFDSLFKKQSTDSTITNNRQLITSFYNLKKKNPPLAKILDTLKVGNVSLPIHTSDGWYLVKLENISHNLISTETDVSKLRSESIESVKMDKMERFSNQYVNGLMSKAVPIIRKDELSILRSYIANFRLPKEKYEKWHMAERMDSTLSALKIKDNKKLPLLTIVELKNDSITLSEFLNWFWLRDQYIKLNENDFANYSISLEQMIWRMVRDKLLVNEANKKNLSERQKIKDQERWWRDKIVYSYVRNELTNAVSVNNNEIKSVNNNKKQFKTSAELSLDLSKKIFQKINSIKQKTSITINHNILDAINVMEESDPKTIELYIVKKGGLIPRPPYPSIDNDWKSWE